MNSKRFTVGGSLGFLMLLATTLPAEPPRKLSELLLSGDNATRVAAIEQFNKLPSDAQYKLVPDFMVALSDENPNVRKIASRILKAMGVKTEGQIPDAKNELPPAPLATAEKKDKWIEEKKALESDLPKTQKELEAAKPGGDDKWSDLKKMKEADGGHYADLKQQMEMEKKGQVTLDASQLHSETESGSTALAAVTDALKDPSPWVRAQGARRLAMIHPAPVDTIPALIGMINDKDVESRRAAVAALGSFGHLAQEAILPLNAALSDPDAGVRGLADEALKQIRQP